MKFLLLFLLLQPCISSEAQGDYDNYDLYSQYLKQFKVERKGNADFVVRESSDYGRKGDSYIKGVVDVLRGCLKGDKASLSEMAFSYGSFWNTLKKDTLWIGLIDQLNQKIKKEFVIKNNFSPDLQITIINNHAYKKYFGNYKHIEKGWVRFHDHYPIPAFLIDLSEVANDGKRAVFYFASRCGGLCGNGCLVLFYKDGTEWKYLQTLNIWNF